MSARSMTLNHIGTIQVGPENFSITVDAPYRDALVGLDGFSHVWAVWWCDGLDVDEFRDITTVDKPYQQGPDTLGIFATRSPARPNPIAMTPVPVLGIDHEAGVVTIAYVDANDGSPLLDLKPYTPAIDRVRETSSPPWCSSWPQFYEDSATFNWGEVFANAR